MSQELIDRLRRLGVVRGTRHLKSATKKVGSHNNTSATDSNNVSLKGPVEKLIAGGRLEETAVGSCFVVDRVYPVHHRHGSHILGELLEQSPAATAIYYHDDRLSGLDFTDLLFLDTETTGLAGAGTLAFMVGVAYFERSPANEVLTVRQFFLRDHADEPAMLVMLDELLAQKKGLITFNGSTFDLPLLANRYLMNRLPDRIMELPHMDLLSPSRRIWRARLGSVALGALEGNLIGVQRTEEDVPGWLIPTLYNDYIRSGDAGEMRRIFYHNQIDMLSMVTLTSVIGRQFSQPDLTKDPVDLFCLGKWQADLGMVESAETNLRKATEGDLPLSIYHQSLLRLGLLLKQNDRRDEAVPIWQQWAATSMDTVQAHIELAKHYEWHEKDLKTAEFWTNEAITLTNSWREEKQMTVQPALIHRLARLQRKMNA